MHNGRMDVTRTQNLVLPPESYIWEKAAPRSLWPQKQGHYSKGQNYSGNAVATGSITWSMDECVGLLWFIPPSCPLLSHHCLSFTESIWKSVGKVQFSEEGQTRSEHKWAQNWHTKIIPQRQAISSSKLLEPGVEEIVPCVQEHSARKTCVSMCRQISSTD